MIKKNCVFHCRVDSKSGTAIELFCKNMSLTPSGFISLCIHDYITKNKNKIKGVKDLIGQISKERDKRRALDRIKSYNHCCFIIKNAYRTILQQQWSFIFNSGSVNMGILKGVVENYVRLYETFDSDLKKELSEEIKMLRKLENKDQLKAKFGEIAYLKENHGMGQRLK